MGGRREGKGWRNREKGVEELFIESRRTKQMQQSGAKDEAPLIQGPSQPQELQHSDLLSLKESAQKRGRRGKKKEKTHPQELQQS